MVSAASPDRGTLVLADAKALPEPAALCVLLDRIGVLAEHRCEGDDSLLVQLGGTQMTITQGAPIAMPPGHAVGGVVTDPPATGQSLTLKLAAQEHDRAQRLAAVQRLCVLAAMVADLIGAERLYWSPAGLWSPTAVLAEAVAASEGEGLPPVMHLVAFLPTAGGYVVTRGLSHFAEGELMLAGAVHLPFAERVRRLARLTVHAMLVGSLLPDAEIPGLLPGETIRVGAMVPGDHGPVTVMQLRQRP